MVRTTRPNKKGGEIPNKDTFTRINFMFQATHLMLQQNPNNTELIRYYCNSVKSIAKKQVLRLHPHVKRVICMKCAMLLVPGITASVRKKSKKQKHIIFKCLDCGTPKRFPLNLKHKLWGEQPSAWFSTYPEGTPAPTETGDTNVAQSSEATADNSTRCTHKRCRNRPKCRKLKTKSDSSELTQEPMDLDSDSLGVVKIECESKDANEAGDSITDVVVNGDTCTKKESIIDSVLQSSYTEHMTPEPTLPSSTNASENGIKHQYVTQIHQEKKTSVILNSKRAVDLPDVEDYSKKMKNESEMEGVS